MLKLLLLLLFCSTAWEQGCDVTSLCVASSGQTYSTIQAAVDQIRDEPIINLIYLMDSSYTLTSEISLTLANTRSGFSGSEIELSPWNQAVTITIDEQFNAVFKVDSVSHWKIHGNVGNGGSLKLVNARALFEVFDIRNSTYWYLQDLEMEIPWSTSGIRWTEGSDVLFVERVKASGYDGWHYREFIWSTGLPTLFQETYSIVIRDSEFFDIERVAYMETSNVLFERNYVRYPDDSLNDCFGGSGWWIDNLYDAGQMIHVRNNVFFRDGSLDHQFIPFFELYFRQTYDLLQDIVITNNLFLYPGQVNNGHYLVKFRLSGSGDSMKEIYVTNNLGYVFSTEDAITTHILIGRNLDDSSFKSMDCQSNCHVEDNTFRRNMQTYTSSQNGWTSANIDMDEAAFTFWEWGAVPGEYYRVNTDFVGTNGTLTPVLDFNQNDRTGSGKTSLQVSQGPFEYFPACLGNYKNPPECDICENFWSSGTCDTCDPEKYQGGSCDTCTADFTGDECLTCTAAGVTTFCNAVGSCSNTGSGTTVVCDCPADFEGLDCGDCSAAGDLNLCNGGGSCTNAGGTTTCVCTGDFETSDCSDCTDPAGLTNQCNGEATSCVLTNGAVDCTCNADFYGDTCVSCPSYAVCVDSGATPAGNLVLSLSAAVAYIVSNPDVRIIYLMGDLTIFSDYKFEHEPHGNATHPIEIRPYTDTSVTITRSNGGQPMIWLNNVSYWMIHGNVENGGSLTITQTNTDASSFFLIERVSHLTFKDFELSTSSANPRVLWFASDVENCVMENLVVSKTGVSFREVLIHTAGSAVYPPTTRYRLVIRNCEFYKTTRLMKWIESGVLIENNYIQADTTRGTDNQLFQFTTLSGARSTYDINIRNNVIERIAGTTTDSLVYFLVFLTSHNRFDEITFEHNTFITQSTEKIFHVSRTALDTGASFQSAYFINNLFVTGFSPTIFTDGPLRKTGVNCSVNCVFNFNSFLNAPDYFEDTDGLDVSSGSFSIGDNNTESGANIVGSGDFMAQALYEGYHYTDSPTTDMRGVVRDSIPTAGALEFVCEGNFGNPPDCDACPDGFMGVATDCVTPCPSGCLGSPGVCSDAGACTEGCDDGFYDTANGCPENCPTGCGGAGNCSDLGTPCLDGCDSGFYNESTGCSLRCSPSCEQVGDVCNEDTGDCLSCPPGMYGLDTYCLTECDINCKQTGDVCDDSTGECIACATGYWGVSCDENCTHCLTNECFASNGNCTSCADQKWGDHCENNCMECTSCDQATGEICDSCVTNYWNLTDGCSQSCSGACSPANECFDVNGNCTACPDGDYGPLCEFTCDNCTACDQETGLVCPSCVVGQYDLTNGCYEVCPGDCVGDCLDDTGNCTSCPAGRYGPKCEETCDNCTSCDQETGLICTSCVAGQYDLTNGCYEVCPDGCDGDCLDVNGNCTLCDVGKYGPKCEETCDNCTSCDQETGLTCPSCIVGHYDLDNGCYEECPVDCVGDCLDDTGNCTACPAGNYGAMCEFTCDNCTSCDQETGLICPSCIIGQYDLTNGCYEECPVDCVGDCLDANGNCTDCVAGKYGPMCEEACDNCTTCDQETGKICASCIAEHYDLDNGCVELCSVDCNPSKSCFDVNGNCTACPDGNYGLMCEFTCDNCTACDQKTGLVCPSCIAGQYDLTNGCYEVCPDGCDGDCLDVNGNCTLCDVGKYGARCDNTCDNCTSCDQQTGLICPSCIVGQYDLTNGCYEECPGDCVGDCLDDTGNCTSCPVGRFGPKCEFLCDNCTSCDQDTGLLCPSCIVGQYDLDNGCYEECPVDCVGDCLDDTGNCTSCTAGKHGAHCSIDCPANCTGVCDQSTGQACTGCDSGTWSMNTGCNETCSEYCLSSICSQVDGKCTDCQPGRYSEFCELPCPSNCSLACDKTTGECDACAVGFWGEQCDLDCHEHCFSACRKNTSECINCEIGYTGANCTQNCSSGCVDSCDQDTGVCGDCNAKWWGALFCDQQCSDCDACDRATGLVCTGCSNGKWNQTNGCSESCSSTCVSSGECEEDDGHCSSGCEIGYYGFFCGNLCPPNCTADTCNQTSGDCGSCDVQLYGPKCSLSCENCTSCDQATGDVCPSCVTGYWGLDSGCDNVCSMDCLDSGECLDVNGNCTACPDGKYGSVCSQSCDNCTSCDQETGMECPSCVTGFWELDTGCSQACSVDCLTSGECIDFNGNCTGCREGKYGSHCEIDCPTNCNGTCDQFTGDCASCNAQYFGLKCDESCSNCTACDQDTGDICDDCVDGAWKKDSGCDQQCSVECLPTNRCDAATGNCANCQAGQWDLDDGCNQPCSSTCDPANVCDEVDGNCTTGCQDGWYGLQCGVSCGAVGNCNNTCEQWSGNCDSCVDTYWGDSCSSDCSFCESCDQETGKICSDCVVGKWSLTTGCNESCSGTCDGDCIDSNGNCTSCDLGNYGPHCLVVCPTNCASECDQFTGECLGCKTPWWGPICNDSCANCVSCDQLTGTNCSDCVATYFGPSTGCQDVCSATCDGNCDSFTGNCPNCLDYYYSLTTGCDLNCSVDCLPTKECEEVSGNCSACQPMKYGQFCENNCDSNCGTGCEKGSGICDNCDSRRWGDLCENQCANCTSCDQSTGQDCPGCNPGAWSTETGCNETCNINCLSVCSQVDGSCAACNPGRYGVQCEFPCPSNCSLACDKATGECDACSVGFWGENCDLDCHEHCLSTCSQNSSECNACQVGYTGVNCTLNCSSGCVDNCEQSTGICDACDDKWWGVLFCDQPCASCVICDRDTGLDCTACEPGKWNQTNGCSSNCSKTCASSGICEEDDGECSSGCETGKHGFFCELDCPEGCVDSCVQGTGVCDACKAQLWGNVCQNNCSNCTSCEQSDGLDCSATGCIEGHWDRTDGCRQLCSDDCDPVGICADDTGYCPDCQPGLRGDFCESDCSSGCNITCEQSTEKCDKCMDGFWDDMCLAPCEFCTQCDQDFGQTCPHCVTGQWRLTTGCDQNCSSDCFPANECYEDTGDCWECQVGQTGPKCGVSCPLNCNNSCLQVGEDCDNGCKDQWYGSHCQSSCSNCTSCDQVTGDDCPSCVTGYWGLDSGCDQRCSYDCLPHNECIDLDGNCTDCQPGNYGAHCELGCPQYCVDTCDQATGNCDACTAPHWGDKCEFTCENCTSCDKSTGLDCAGCVTGHYSKSTGCDLLCSDDCLPANECYDVNGNCSACQDGLYGPHCATPCVSGCNGTCAQDTGVCDVCDAQLYGLFCNMACPNCTECDQPTGQSCTGCVTGTWSLDTGCDQPCSSDCNPPFICMALDGSCPCASGTWGDICTLPCPDGCVDACDKFKGKCDACESNLYGDNCTDVCALCTSCEQSNGLDCAGCVSGRWDLLDGCSQNCSDHCNPSGLCQANNGSCAICENGFYGEGCTVPCDGNCESTCEKISGNCDACDPQRYEDDCSKLCVDCVNSCDQQTGQICDSCVDGKWELDTGCSQNCSDHCDPANRCAEGDGACSACQPLRWNRTNGCSTLCPGNCDGDCDELTGLCSACADGSYGVQCLQNCPDDCTRCDFVTGSCTQCDADFFITTTGECVNCAAMAHCEACDDAQGCTSCEKGWYRNTCELDCTQNTASCVECALVDGTCTLCADDFDLTGTDSCVPCASGTWGERCQNFTCGMYRQGDGDVCGGIGQCTGVGVCTGCPENYDHGAFCLGCLGDYDFEEQCTLCYRLTHDETQNCSVCKEPKFDIDKNCMECLDTTKTYSSDCVECENEFPDCVDSGATMSLPGLIGGIAGGVVAILLLVVIVVVAVVVLVICIRRNKESDLEDDMLEIELDVHDQDALNVKTTKPQQTELRKDDLKKDEVKDEKKKKEEEKKKKKEDEKKKKEEEKKKKEEEKKKKKEEKEKKKEDEKKKKEEKKKKKEEKKKDEKKDPDVKRDVLFKKKKDEPEKSKAPPKPEKKKEAPAKPEKPKVEKKAPPKPEKKKAPPKPEKKKAPPKPEKKKAPVKPEKKAPAKPEKKAPVKPEKKAPTKPEKKAPAKPEKAPAKPEKKAPAKPEKSKKTAPPIPGKKKKEEEEKKDKEEEEDDESSSEGSDDSDDDDSDDDDSDDSDDDDDDSDDSDDSDDDDSDDDDDDDE